MNSTYFILKSECELKLPYYAVGVGCYYRQEHVIRPKGYPYYQWIQCHQGKGELIIDGSTFSVEKNRGIFLYPGIPHEYYSVCDSWEVDWIILGGIHMDDFIKHTAGIEKSDVFYISQPEIILSKIRKILAIHQSASPMKNLDCSRITYDILIDIMKTSSIKSDSSMDNNYGRLKPVFDYIELNYSRIVTLNDLSEVMGITPQHLCNLFRKTTHLTIFEYVNSIRIKKSKEYILNDKNMKIKDISVLCGYNDLSYFSAMFKKIEHISPKEFKKLHV